MTGPGQRPRSLPAFSEAQRLASRPRGILLRPPRSKAEASKNSPLPPACPPGMLAALLWKRRARVPSKKPTQDIPKNSRAFCCPTPSRRTPGGFSEAVVIRKMFGFSALRGDVKSTARCGLWMRTPAGSEAPPGGPKRVPGGFSSSYSSSQSIQGVPAPPPQPPQPQIPIFFFIPWLGPGWCWAHPHRTQPPPPTLSKGALPKLVPQRRAPTGPTAHGTGEAEPRVTSSSPPRAARLPGVVKAPAQSEEQKIVP